MMTVVAAVVGPAMAALSGLVVWNIKESKKTAKETRDTREKINGSVRVLLRSQLIHMHQQITHNGVVSVSEREGYYEIYNLYKEFGGNGLIDRLTQQVDDVEIVYTKDLLDRKQQE